MNCFNSMQNNIISTSSKEFSVHSTLNGSNVLIYISDIHMTLLDNNIFI